MAGIAPGKPFTSELDFSGQSYVDAASKAEDDVARAVDIIKEKLPVLGQLKGLVSVALGIDRPPLFVDARSGEATLLDQCDHEPDTKLTIKPEYIAQFYDGKLEPRYGLFKDAFFHPAAMPQGSLALAIKFGDLLTPVPPSLPPAPPPTGRLPTPTRDLEQVKRDVLEFGYGLLADALTPAQVAFLRRAVREQAAGETAAGVGKADAGGANQRIWTLINKGEEFLDFLNHPLIDAIVPWFLGEHAILHSYSANITRPGGEPMQLHTDQIAIQPPDRSRAFGLNILWFLEDFTAANGGTRVHPGSHVGDVAPADIFSLDGTVAAEGPAGTALVLESRLWHATGPNVSGGGERPAVLMFFMRSFIRQQENHFLSLRKDVEARLSDRHKRMLGFCTTGALGGIEGEIREGTYVSRKEDCVGRMRAPHEESA